VERAASGELAGGLGLERVQARAPNIKATMSGRRILVGSRVRSDLELEGLPWEGGVLPRASVHDVQT
jgi:hypothetical protein